ncbi:hypothetical protein [Synechococcus sp. PCC 7336]|uniref:hypothetical protein n=1 Tax=Synechococcus sp. PCC 7336 TaxID=195250 RepID=UPI00034BF743|nr:hypothetical protein [Synechococcus sp. PCC 7336]
MDPEIGEELDRLERIASLNLQTSTNNLEAIGQLREVQERSQRQIDQQGRQIGQLREAQERSQRQIDSLAESTAQLKQAVDYLQSKD